MRRFTELITKNFNLSTLDKDIVDSLFPLQSPKTISQLNKILHKRGKNLYRSIKKLQSIGLIKVIESWPKQYILSSKEEIKQLFLQKQFEFANIVKSFDGAKDPKQIIRMISNRDSYRKTGKELMKTTEKSLYVIASGSEQDSDFFLEHYNLVKRGVSVCILITKYNPQLNEMYTNWIKNGIQVRIAQQYSTNLVIYDSKIVQIGLKNQKY